MYVSTKNFTFPKGLAQKLIPKYEGPYLIADNYGNNSYQVKISDSLCHQDMHDVFHAALFRIHKHNDDRLFPGRLDEQIIGEELEEWAAEAIVVYKGVQK